MSRPEQVTADVYAITAAIASLRDSTPFPADARVAGQFHERRAAEYLAARMLLRRLVGEVADSGLAVSPLASRRGGQPFLTARPEIGISLSHTDGWAAAAVHLRGRVGVDVQAPAPVSRRLLRRCCTLSARRALARLPEAERCREFAWIWAVQESCVKATGRGLAGRPWTIPVEVGQASGNWGDVQWSAARRDCPVAFACAYGTAPTGTAPARTALAGAAPARTADPCTG